MMLVFAITTRGASRCVLKIATGMPGLDRQRLVVLELQQRVDDRVVGLPVARALADPAVDHQPLGLLGDLHVVLEHAQQRLLLPALAAQRVAALRGDGVEDLVLDRVLVGRDRVLIRMLLRSELRLPARLGRSGQRAMARCERRADVGDRDVAAVLDDRPAGHDDVGHVGRGRGEDQVLDRRSGVAPAVRGESRRDRREVGGRADGESRSSQPSERMPAVVAARSSSAGA